VTRVRFDGVSISLGGRPVLSDISCEIRPSRRTAIVGPNGGGKTTLMRILLGLLRPDSGTVRFLDAEGKELPRPRIGYLPQRSSLSADAPVSGLDLVALSLDLGFGLRGSAAANEGARHALQRAGLPAELAALPVGRLSGGQRQRVLLARAIAGRPEILVLDEPDTALDRDGMMKLRRLVGEELAQGTTIVYVTHDSAAMGGADDILRVDVTATREAEAEPA
jgi:ABC-type Mn2+/Zn2+ transport system ATPase subunit